MTLDQSSRGSPLAIVGIGCRFPGGADTPRRFWEMLLEGRDAIVDVPSERWDTRRFHDPNPKRPGKMYVSQAGFLEQKLDEFDPTAFGISPREASYLDPQQRLLLEVSWEALEDAGVPLDAVRGKDVGVFVGGFALDRMTISLMRENQPLIGMHSATSASMTMLANRVSHAFDLRGPSTTMDTACSASLMALHFACRSLWSGDCSMALIGGVNAILEPWLAITMCKGGFLSEHGRCMAFDERAGGFVRAEGAGMVVVEPLEAALRAGHRIYASIVATGTNQDGHTAGIALPNGEAQAALLRRVLSDAGVAPHEVRYVEAHGTGTQAGDPAEVAALDSALRGSRQREAPLLVGSVKTNVGHLEAAAGVAGLIKAALVLHHGEVPPNLHFETPSPAIAWNDRHLRVVTERTPLPGREQGDTVYAGVNSFGYGGANVHALLAAQPLRQETAGRGDDLAWGEAMPFVLPASAHDPATLRAVARSLADELEVPTSRGGPALRDVGHVLVHRRARHAHRAAFVAGSREQLAAVLRDVSADRPNPSAVLGSAPAERGRLAFAYSGMGTQFPGMAREVFRERRVFRDAIEEVDAIFRPLSGWSLVDELFVKEEAFRANQTRIGQPLNFALQVGLTRLWASFGIVPDAVVGHSAGEIAGAWACGALRLGDAVRLAYHRSEQQSRRAGTGTLLAAGLSPEQAERYCAEFEGVSVAAMNGPTAVTLVGEHAALRELAGLLEELGVFQRMLDVDAPYHGPLMDGIEHDLRAAIRDVRPQASTIPMVSTVTGDWIAGARLDEGYWWMNVRRPVAFMQGIQRLVDDGYTYFLELGPHPVLRAYLREILALRHAEGHSFASLHRREKDLPCLARNAGELWVRGFEPDWDALAPADGSMISLPGYPWQRSSYWHESKRSRMLDRGRPGAHVCLQTPADVGTPSWEVELSTQMLPWLDDHQVAGAVVFPGAAYLDGALAMVAEREGTEGIVLEDVDFRQLCVVQPDVVTSLELSLAADGTFSMRSAELVDEIVRSWTLHARGRWLVDESQVRDVPDVAEPVQKIAERLPVARQDMSAFHAALTARGLAYGSHFRTLLEIRAGRGEVLATLEAHDPGDVERSASLLYPPLLDGALQALLALFDEDERVRSLHGDAALVPVSVGRLRFLRRPGAAMVAHGRLLDASEREVRVDLDLFDRAGNLCATLRRLALQPIATRSASADGPLAFRAGWIEQSAGTRRIETQRASILGSSPLLEGLSSALARCGLEVSADLFDGTNPALVVVDASNVPAGGEVGPLADRILELVALARRLSRLDTPPRLCVVSVGAFDDIDPAAPSIHAVWGLSRVLRSELPELTIRMIDLAATDPELLERLADEVVADSAETEIRFERERRLVHRLEPYEQTEDEAQPSAERLDTTEHAAELAIDGPGQLSTVHFREVERAAPNSGEVELRISHVGLNFKDLLKLTGQLSPLVTRGTFSGDEVGMECSATVLRVGPGETRFAVGDEVVATLGGCFRTHVTTASPYVMKRPRSLDRVGAVMMLPFATALHGLADIARLRRGEHVLIHAATGGVGLAAIQVAHQLGAEIHATAGSEAKREHLRNLGIERVSDSRSLAFVDDVLRWTDGRGVDVVLSAQTGAAMTESVRLLARYGRFVDIGKRDMIEDNVLPLRPFNAGLTYAALDLDRMFEDRVEDTLDLLRRVVEGFERGDYQPLPSEVFSAEAIGDALRFMAQARHIGKILVSLEAPRISARSRPRGEASGTERVQVISGGLGGFGLELARRLASTGADRLVLLGRRGLASPGAADAVDALRSQGVKVHVEAVDVADGAALNAALERARAELGPIGGIFHCAGVLEDRLLTDLDREGLIRVLAPKVAGATHLHELTLDDPIERFVLFSSAAVLVGNTGQGSYVVANAYLDGLARQRHAAGLPALSINWGLLGEVGMAARDPLVRAALESSGLSSIAPRDAFDALDDVIASAEPQLALLGIDWERWAAVNDRQAALPFFSRVLGSAGAGGASSPAFVLARSMLRVALDSWPVELAERLREIVAPLLSMSPDAIDIRRSVGELGVDSLLALELVATAQARGFDVSGADLMQGRTLLQIGHAVGDKLKRILVAGADQLLAAVDELEEAELDRLTAIVELEKDGGDYA